MIASSAGSGHKPESAQGGPNMAQQIIGPKDVDRPIVASRWRSSLSTAFRSRAFMLVPWTLGLLVIGAAVLAQPSFGQTADAPRGTIPGQARPPMACRALSPNLTLSTTAPFMTDLVGWWAEGFQPSGLVAWTVTDLLSGDEVARGSVTTDGFCNIHGSFRLPVPSGYHFEVKGAAYPSGEAVTLSAFPRAVLLPPPAPTPTPLTRPAAPSHFNVSPLSANTIRFDWVDNSQGETGFLISSRTGDINRPANSNTHTQGGFTTNDAYCFSLFAVNEAGPAYGGTDCVLLVSEEFRANLPPPPGPVTRP
jgi:hypothetical protein